MSVSSSHPHRHHVLAALKIGLPADVVATQFSLDVATVLAWQQEQEEEAAQAQTSVTQPGATTSNSDNDPCPVPVAESYKYICAKGMMRVMGQESDEFKQYCKEMGLDYDEVCAFATWSDTHDLCPADELAKLKREQQSIRQKLDAAQAEMEVKLRQQGLI